VLTPVFSAVRVTRSLVLYVCFIDRCLSFCTFSFDRILIAPLVSSNSSLLWAHKTSLTRLLSIVVPVPSHRSGSLCMWVLGETTYVHIVRRSKVDKYKTAICVL